MASRHIMLMSARAFSTASKWFVAVALAVVPVLAYANAEANHCELRVDRKVLRYDGKSIRVNLLSPHDDGRPRSLIIMAHGSAGVFQDETGIRDNFGEHHLACAGATVAIVHYMDYSDLKFALGEDTIRRNFHNWVMVLKAALDYILINSETPPTTVAVLGESLGGYLGITLGLSDPRIKIVSAFSSGVPAEAAQAIKNGPIVLLYHGRNDAVIPVDEAQRSCDWLNQRKVPCKLRIFEGLNHGLSGQAIRDVADELKATIDQLTTSRSILLRQNR